MICEVVWLARLQLPVVFKYRLVTALVPLASDSRILSLARRFHPTLFPKPATRPYDSNLSLSISDLANEAIECTHPTFLFLYSLATGDTLITNLRDQIRNMKIGSVSEPKKDLLAIFSAFQLLQSLYANQNAYNKQNTNSQLAIGSLLYDLQVE
jgi:hypothetical protein